MNLFQVMGFTHDLTPVRTRMRLVMACNFPHSSHRQRTVSAACRLGSPATNCSTVTSVSRQTAGGGCSTRRREEVSEVVIAGEDARGVAQPDDAWFPCGKQARTMRVVSSGTAGRDRLLSDLGINSFAGSLMASCCSPCRQSQSCRLLLYEFAICINAEDSAATLGQAVVDEEVR